LLGWHAGGLSLQGRGWARPCALPPAPRPCGPRSPALLAQQGRLSPSASHGRHDARASRLCSDLDMLVVAPRLGASRYPLLSCAAQRRPSAPEPAHPRPCRHGGGMRMACFGGAGKAVGGCAVARLMRRRGAENSWPRAQRAMCSDSSRLSEHSERSERREFRDGPRVRAPEGTLRAAKGAASRATPHTQPRLCSLGCRAWAI
jgi:hypothetical protein